MTTFKKLSLAAILGAISFTSFAAEKPSNPLSECGIGATLFPKYDGAALVSNIIWDLGTTALTSATMSPETCAGVDKEAAAFIYNTYDSLMADTARGEGEYLDALAGVMNVEAEAQNTFKSEVRASVAQLISSEEYAAMSQTDKAYAVYLISSKAA